MAAERPTIFVVASYMHAFVVRADRYPEPGETVFGTDSEIGPGGKGQNQAIAAARLGGAVTVLACVGADAFGTAACELWEREGLDTRYVRVSSTSPTGMAFITLDARGQNRIIVVAGANGLLTASDAQAADAAIAAAQVVVAQFESPLAAVERALTLARQHGARTVLNPAPARDVSDALLSHVDVITPNESETQALTGIAVDCKDPAPAARALLDRGPRSVVLTLGEAGAYVLDRSGGRRIPGVGVPVVDTTGAGDAFTGALAVALARGTSLDEAAAFANLAGAFCVTRPGVVPGLGSESEVLSLQRTSL